VTSLEASSAAVGKTVVVLGSRWKVLLAGPSQAVLPPGDSASPKGLMFAVPVHSRVPAVQPLASPKGLMLAVPVQSRVPVAQAPAVAAAAAAVAAVAAAVVAAAGTVVLPSSNLEAAAPVVLVQLLLQQLELSPSC